MKLLYLSDSYLPSESANSVHVMKMCSALANSGHSVTVACYLEKGSIVEPFDYYGVGKKFDLLNIARSRIPGMNRMTRFLTARKTLAAQHGYELVYGRDLYGVLGASLGNGDLIYEAHTPPRSYMDHLCCRMLFGRSNFLRLVVISQALKFEFLRRFPSIGESRVMVAHDGADIPDSDAVPMTDLGREGVMQLGYVGSMLPGKGADLVARLAGELPQFDFHIVGGSSQQIAALKAEFASENLYLHGHVQHAAVIKYLRAFDIALFPMQSSVIVSDGTDIAKWTSPMKLFEYMAASRTIIASDFPVIREILIDGRNATLVPPDQVDCWISAIKDLARQPDRRKTLAVNALEDLKHSYTWDSRAVAVLS